MVRLALVRDIKGIMVIPTGRVKFNLKSHHKDVVRWAVHGELRVELPREAAERVLKPILDAPALRREQEDAAGGEKGAVRRRLMAA